MKLSLEIMIDDDQQAAQLFAKLVGQIQDTQPNRFDYTLTPSRAATTSKASAVVRDAVRREVSTAPRKEVYRPMGALKLEAFELLERDKANYLTVAEAGRLCGYEAGRFKSTLVGAYGRDEVDRKEINGVWGYRLNAKGQALLDQEKRNRAEQAAKLTTLAA